MRPRERRVHDVLIASTVIVVGSVVVTTHVRPEGAPAAALAAVTRTPAIRIPPPPPDPVVPCPATRARGGYNDHSWIDPSGQRTELACRGDVAITRSAGADGALGTADDVCRRREASCTLVAAERPDAA